MNEIAVSIIIPIFNEQDNIRPLVDRIEAAMFGSDYEMIFVNDSTDCSQKIVESLITDTPLPIRHLDRASTNTCWGRLGGAVVDGFGMARGGLFVVMDGDGQHPPELIPEMVQAAHEADLVVASRYILGGDAGGLSGCVRKVVSRATGLVAKLSFPYRLKACTDPMSGFFLVRRSRLDLSTLRPKGFKILLEIIARCKPMRVQEVAMILESALLVSPPRVLLKDFDLFDSWRFCGLSTRRSYSHLLERRASFPILPYFGS